MYNIILLSVYRSILEYELDLEKEKKESFKEYQRF